jgi:hypothetical protein
MSPGSRRSEPKVRIAFGICSTIDPRWTGCAKPCAIDRRLASKNAHEKSERVLMFVEYALRLRESTISSVAATSAFRITSNEIGSSLPARAVSDTLCRGDVARRDFESIDPHAASLEQTGAG